MVRVELLSGYAESYGKSYVKVVFLKGDGYVDGEEKWWCECRNTRHRGHFHIVADMDEGEELTMVVSFTSGRFRRGARYRVEVSEGWLTMVYPYGERSHEPFVFRNVRVTGVDRLFNISREVAEGMAESVFKGSSSRAEEMLKSM